MRSALLNIMVAGRHQGRPLAHQGFRRSRKPAGLGEGSGRLRLQRRQARRGDRLRRAAEGPPDLCLPGRGRHAKSPAPTASTAGSSIRSTAPPISCTASRCSPCAIALERDNEIVASVIYNPVMDELFTAEKGGGAWLNDRKRLRVAGRKHLADAVVVTGINSRGRAIDLLQLKQLAQVTPAVAGIRRTGSASTDLAWLAAGRFDGYWEAGLAPWDVAPGCAGAARGRRHHVRLCRHARLDLERRGRRRQRDHPGPVAEDRQSRPLTRHSGPSGGRHLRSRSCRIAGISWG